MYWNGQHCVIFESYKFREKVFRRIQGVDRTGKPGKPREFFLTGKNRENPGNFI